MAKHDLKIFDETLHTTHSWLKDLMERLSTDNRNDAYLALKVTLHALRDRLPVNSAATLAAQFPTLIRGFYYEGWQPAKCPSQARSEKAFLASLAEAFGYMDDFYEPRRIVGAVFDLLNERISEGEINKIQSCLPKNIRNLWPPLLMPYDAA